MTKLDFFFDKPNLAAAAAKLAATTGSPTHGKSAQDVEEMLIVSAIKLFEHMFKSAPVSALLVNDGVLQVPVIYNGFGAIFSAGRPGSGPTHLLVSRTEEVNVTVEGNAFAVSVDFWSYLS